LDSTSTKKASRGGGEPEYGALPQQLKVNSRVLVESNPKKRPTNNLRAISEPRQRYRTTINK